MRGRDLQVDEGEEGDEMIVELSKKSLGGSMIEWLRLKSFGG